MLQKLVVATGGNGESIEGFVIIMEIVVGVLFIIVALCQTYQSYLLWGYVVTNVVPRHIGRTHGVRIVVSATGGVVVADNIFNGCTRLGDVVIKIWSVTIIVIR